MKRLKVLIAGLGIALGLLAGPSFARTTHRPVRRACCIVAAGTEVSVALVNEVSTRSQKSGDMFALRLAAPLIINGRVVLRAGATGEGQVIDAAKPGLGGKPAKLVLAARFLNTRHGRLMLQGMALAGAGRDNSSVANAAGVAGIVFAPLGVVGIIMPGGEAAVRAGAVASAKVAADLRLPSLGRAPGEAVQAEASTPEVEGTIPFSAPPPGKGMVVFFRAKSLLGAGQWFNVREGGKVLGKLTNGTYFVQIAEPGAHTYTDSLEPEFKDKLKIEVDPGETYYIAGTLTKGVIIGAADLSLSDRAAFDKASKAFKPAAPPPESPPAPPSKAPPSEVAPAPAPADAADPGAASAPIAAPTPPPPTPPPAQN